MTEKFNLDLIKQAELEIDAWLRRERLKEHPQGGLMPAKKRTRDGWTTFFIRVPNDKARAIEDWRARQTGPQPSKSDLVRQAIEEFLDRRA